SVRHTPPTPTRFPYTTLFRSREYYSVIREYVDYFVLPRIDILRSYFRSSNNANSRQAISAKNGVEFVHRYASTSAIVNSGSFRRSEEHTSELQSRFDLVCRLL